MLLQLLDILACPKCGSASRLWKLKGELTDTRITNGEVICPKDHTWIVKEEILRFDEEHSDQPMEFLEHPRTGFPNEVGEQERFDFFDVYENAINNVGFETEDIVVVTGDPILFMKYLKEQQQSRFIIAYPDEGTLRQLQETAARKRMYDQMAFVKAENVGYIGNVKSIHLLDKNTAPGKNIILVKEPVGEVLWTGEETSLVIIDQ